MFCCPRAGLTEEHLFDVTHTVFHFKRGLSAPSRPPGGEAVHLRAASDHHCDCAANFYLRGFIIKRTLDLTT